MSPVSGSSDIFLHVHTKRGGKIKGEAVSAGHEEEIVVSSWRWAAQASSGLGASHQTARRSYSGLTVTKAIDSASTGLLSALATNDEVKEAVLAMRKSGGEAMDYFFVRLKEARVTQIEHASDDQGSNREVVTFAFRKVEVEYRRQQQGGGKGASSVFTDEVVVAA